MGTSHQNHEVIRSLADIPLDCLEYKQSSATTGHDTGSAGESEDPVTSQNPPRKKQPQRLKDVMDDLTEAGVVLRDDALDFVRELCRELGTPEFRLEQLSDEAVASKELCQRVSDLLEADPPARTFGALAYLLVSTGLAAHDEAWEQASIAIAERYERLGVVLPEGGSWATLADPRVVSLVMREIVTDGAVDDSSEPPVTYEVQLLEADEESDDESSSEGSSLADSTDQDDVVAEVDAPLPLDSSQAIQARQLELSLSLTEALSRARDTTDSNRSAAFTQLLEAVIEVGYGVYGLFGLSETESEQLLLGRRHQDLIGSTIVEVKKNPELNQLAWYYRGSVQLLRSEQSVEDALTSFSWPKFSFLLKKVEQDQRSQALSEAAIPDPTPDPVEDFDDELTDEVDESERISARAKQLADAGELSIEEILSVLEEEFV